MSFPSVKLSRVLNEIDVAVLPDSTQHSFSIRFIKSNGESVFLNRAVKTGLNFNLKKNAMRGFRPVDANLNPIGHIYPVSIWHIVEFNQQIVCL